jgi:hypothetical protein
LRTRFGELQANRTPDGSTGSRDHRDLLAEIDLHVINPDARVKGIYT